jgi:ankyrin repeat protein
MARLVWLALVLLVCSCGSSHKGDRRKFLVAAEAGDVAGVRHELENGVSPDDVFNLNDPTALYLAATNGNEEVVRVLLAAGADPSAQYRGSSLKTEIQSFRARLVEAHKNPDAPSSTYRKQDGVVVELRALPLHEDAYDPILKMIEQAAAKQKK